MGEELYHIKIPINPITKKNSQRILSKRVNGKTVPFIAPSDTFIQYQKDAGWFVKRPSKPIDEPVEITCIFRREKAIRCDLTNLLEAIDDVLVHYGVIADDNFNIIKSHDGSRVYVDKSNVGTEIIIRRFTE